MRTLLVPAPLLTGEVRIEGDEAHHGRSVLRLVAGDQVRVADGAGHAGIGVVATVERHRLIVTVPQVDQLADDPAALLTIAVAAPKGDRFSDLVRGLCELGVGTILPLSCERGERIPALDRSQRIAAEALKQCRRARLPRIGPVVEIPTLAAQSGPRIVLDHTGACAQPGTLTPTVLIIGPEGGLTDGELRALHAGGVVTARLAGPILRIETAALAAAAVWTAAWEATR